jgi:hypothetical protein
MFLVMASTWQHRWGTWLAGASLVLVGALAVGDFGVAPTDSGVPAAAYDLVALPEGVDSLTSLVEASRIVSECAPSCRGVVYAWTPRMPLSRSGIPNVVEAARSLGVPVTLVSSEELLDYAEGNAGVDARESMVLADAMLAGGALAHSPALVVYAAGDVVGSAILGYKRADAYAAFVSDRLSAASVASPSLSSPEALPIARRARMPSATPVLADYRAIGIPGAYFRWVPGTRQIAYESDRTVYLLDLVDGEHRIAPGWIDFVPTPDGRFFVTPGPDDDGLTFYDARDVFDAAARNRSMSVESIFTDNRMRDQYPSVGILESGDSYTRYRVLTSWFRGLLYRDYEVRVNPSTGVSSVRPIGEPTVPCEALALSTPIMSQDGREVAARDERTGTTKIFRMLEEGRCEEVLDFGTPTSKVAWHASGQRIAFATPRRARGGVTEAGIFVFDRASGAITAVPGSEDASRLAFPDFVGDDVVFLIPADAAGSESIFRLVDGLE